MPIARCYKANSKRRWLPLNKFNSPQPEKAYLPWHTSGLLRAFPIDRLSFPNDDTPIEKGGTKYRAPAGDEVEVWLAVAEILNVAVGAEADVIGQVPAVVIGIVVDYDLVGGPIPVVTKTIVIGRHAEVEAAEPEALAVAAFDAPLMAAADAAGEAAMLPGMIEVIVRIIAS